MREVKLREYMPCRDGGYVLRMLGELYDSQSQLFLDGCQVRLKDPVADISGHIVDIIFYGDRRVGIILSAPSGCFEDTVSIADIVVEEEFRGKGIGREALKQVFHHAKCDGAKYISLNVHSDNERAVRLYESLGFRMQSQWMVLDLNKKETGNDKESEVRR